MVSQHVKARQLGKFSILFNSIIATKCSPLRIHRKETCSGLQGRFLPKYSRTPVARTLKGNEKQFELAG